MPVIASDASRHRNGSPFRNSSRPARARPGVPIKPARPSFCEGRNRERAMPSPRSLIQLVRRRLKNSAALPGPRSPRLQDMAIEDLLHAFTDLKQLRRTNTDQVLLKLGAFGAEALAILAHKTSSHRIAWEGAGQKDYKVFSDVGDHASWSRAVNTSLFIEDVATFGTIFQQFATRVIDDRGKLRVE